MTEEENRRESLYQQGYGPLVQVIQILVRRGRQIREAEEGNCDASQDGEVVRDAATANAAYEGMTPGERGIAVYKKWMADELHVSEMTELEWASLQNECKRQSEQTRILIWNVKHHRHFLDRIDSISDRLTKEEQQAIEELLRSHPWGTAELAQAKEIIETAEWFSKLKAP